jgi:hypothetical protein
MTGRKISGKGGGMKPANLLPRALPGLACLFALTACHSTPPLVTNCPNVAVLEQGRVVTLFLPGRQDVAAEIAQAKITGVAGSCTLEKKSHNLRVTFQAGFAATNGPANTSPTLVLPYLISQSEGDQLLSVQSGSITLSFNGNESTTGATTKPITYKLPNTPDTASTDLLVSFHLTPDQLSYNAAHPSP